MKFDFGNLIPYISDTRYFWYPIFPIPNISDTRYIWYDTWYFWYPYFWYTIFLIHHISDTQYLLYPIFMITDKSDTLYFWCVWYMNLFPMPNRGHYYAACAIFLYILYNKWKDLTFCHLAQFTQTMIVLPVSNH